jgi:hypothetical protein
MATPHRGLAHIPRSGVTVVFCPWTPRTATMATLSDKLSPNTVPCLLSVTIGNTEAAVATPHAPRDLFTSH